MTFINQPIYPEITFVESVVTELVPVLFPRYPYGDTPDFRYLGPEGRGKLESALALPKQGWAGQDYYPSLADKSAILLWSITKNHPFLDGNKRAALTTVWVFLGLNRSLLLSTQDDAVKLCVSIASGDSGMSREDVSEWLGERIIALGSPDLSQRLNQFFATLETSADVDSAGAQLRFFNVLLDLMQ